MVKTVHTSVRMKALSLSLFVCAVLIVALLGLFPSCAWAETTPEFTLSVFQKLNYSAGESGLITSWDYELTAQTEGAPLPEGAQGSVFFWQMRGSDERTWKLSAPAAGQEYRYEMRQVAPASLPSVYTPDAHVYDVRVITGTDGSITVLCYLADTKVADPGWTVSYERPQEPGKHPGGFVSKIMSLLPKTGDLSQMGLIAAGMMALAGSGLMCVRKGVVGATHVDGEDASQKDIHDVEE
ncbi:LPXTG cell wall anchor domain-containing protein [Collinsella sp. AGMB00827]|uniref:LPXTG cell wall anchor domain-containing protein n=1 Tax=Collinsella ureilytica TaxID=2869515 RepID=A0ABS7ML30_9ACTN|nr:LPXTG cell wall anchor domain-containing protein [Collinsella urealyticum]MBY4797105.1 LPXTG cell wall anchor domain-containing protein [Collinsella urealyticum]